MCSIHKILHLRGMRKQFQHSLDPQDQLIKTIELLRSSRDDPRIDVQAKESVDKQMHSMRSQLDSAKSTMQQMQSRWDLQGKEKIKAIPAHSAAVEVRFSNLHAVLIT